MPQSNEIRTKPTVHDEFVRMLVLETDEQHPDDHRERGSFGDVFDTLFKKAGDEHDPPLGIETVSHFVVEDKGGSVPKLEEMEDVHAILITGSMYDAHGEEPWVLKLVALIQCIFPPTVSFTMPRNPAADMTSLPISSLAKAPRYPLQRRLLRPPDPLPRPRRQDRFHPQQQMGTGTYPHLLDPDRRSALQ